MSKVALANIPSLTFYRDALTAARRTDPIPQLICVGKPCGWYQPDAILCRNAGGSGTDVNWKCEADLPESLRLGRVEVSCEGWSGPGDPYVLKGSCSLEYRLVHVPDNLRNQNDYDWSARRFNSDSIASILFTIVWTGFLLFILYGFLKSCLGRRPNGTTGGPSPQRPSGWFPGGFGGGLGGPTDPPPPYTPSNTDPKASTQQGWRPGFWTGTALGAAAAYMMGQGNRRAASGDMWRDAREYDWERERSRRPLARGFSSGSRWSEDRGEGPSNLGSMRRSTGFGGSSVR
ncbi:DUF1183-domain-containing protein [Punctularia strigosozonata HHB-11173 SS5]|uniref:Store-operated calcium entry-associated regulatory factor n=1 Tax=Punctularia strigosozonata (strain HHB-11173) TaxID=741275 RepID=R7S1R4_PUNST|nr:DUF1183-domain-containing protein [Punctularia strigosozonata HHB-11173 SS5]EIN03784.1 DUF1183-domain-containing protein [Punctularia strigosozonata HHB-11173 SS5]